MNSYKGKVKHWSRRALAPSRMIVALLSIAGLIGVATSRGLADRPPLPGTHLLPGHLPALIGTLRPVGRVERSKQVDLVIGLRARNTEARTQLLHDLYDPASPQFHQYLDPSKYAARFGPTDADYQTVLAFAKANHLSVVSTVPDRKLLHVRASAAAIEHAFKLTLQNYNHPTEHRVFFAPDREPSVDVRLPISHISGLDSYQRPHRAPNIANGRKLPPPRRRIDAAGSGSGQYTGRDFRTAYAPGITLTGEGQTVGVLEYDGYSPTDIATYERQNGLPEVSLQNAYLSDYPGSDTNRESAADIELVVSMAPGLSKVVVYGANSDAEIVQILHEMTNPTQGEGLPAQITSSYYFFYNSDVYDELAQFVAQGQDFFIASGDYGSYDETTGAGAFPPVDDPHVTAVGGTVLTTDANGAWVSETTDQISGGGYSPWTKDPEFSIPFWQAGMDFSVNQGSPTMRNSPDVAILSENITIYLNGTWTWMAGTSAAAPLWAGFLALANEQAVALGKPRIGFMNPALYAIARSGTCPTCLHDIQTGNNFNATNPTKYSAANAIGFDLCTGWGTPNGQPLVDALVGYGEGWRLVPGGGTTELSDAAVVYNGRLYLFGIGIDDHRHYMNTYDGNEWGGWHLVPGGGTTELSDAAVVYNGRLYLFGIGINDHKHYVNVFDGQTWTGWAPLSGNGTTANADAAVVLGGKLYLFAIGIDNHRHYVNMFDGVGWAGWRELPGGGTTMVADTATVLSNRLYLFSVGIADHHHYMNTFDGVAWSGWSAVPGGGKTELADAATVFNSRLYLFGVGIVDHHHYLNILDGTHWTGWTLLPGGGKTKLADAVTTFRNEIYIFGIGINDHQHYANVFP